MALDYRKVYRYTIRSDRELPPSRPGEVLSDWIEGRNPAQACTRLRLQLFALDNARTPADMNAPGWKLHRLAGALADHWAVSVSGNWRLTFRFEDEDAILVDYQDYH